MEIPVTGRFQVQVGAGLAAVYVDAKLLVLGEHDDHGHWRTAAGARGYVFEQ